MIRRIAFFLITVTGLFSLVNGQNTGNENSADRSLKGSGRVNASTLAMEFDLPLGAYPGRGINVPVNLSYSSKLWRLQYDGEHPVPGGNYSSCSAEYVAMFAEQSASGWTTSMATPYIEYSGAENLFQSDGKPVSYGDVTCPTSDGGNPSYPVYYVKRITVHLPSGETHELRASDTPVSFTIGTTTGTSAYNPANWNATFYATDGSNIQYVQDSSTGTYRLKMPDGSFYDFVSTSGLGDRKATKFTDRNGNYTTFNASNGSWTDTLGRTIEAPIGLQAPDSPTDPEEPFEYAMPGMTGTYKFHWKELKGSSAATSALTNFSNSLKYYGEMYGCLNGSGFPTYCTYSSGSVLFYGPNSGARVRGFALFNPILLSEIELPTGESYKFSYDIFGRIDRIYYPTGGEEQFTYAVVPTLSVLDVLDLSASANFGVVNRKVLETSGDQTPYEWTYSAGYVAPSGYKVSINNPDGTLSERFLLRGRDAIYDAPPFGHDNILAGMQYEQRSFDAADVMVSRKLTHWTKTQFNPFNGNLITGNWTMGGYDILADWHPRVVREESMVFDATGNGVSSTTLIEYNGDLSVRETPVLANKTTQYAFVAIASGSGSGGDSFAPGAQPQSQPTPIPTPTPSSSPVKIVETQYLISDSSYAGVKSYYTAQNMMGLVTASQVKDGAGTVVSRSEMVYDESGRSPGYRGNPTTSKVWDSYKGGTYQAPSNPLTTSNSVSTSARFDSYGNQYEATDAKGNTTTTTFDSTHNAFPVQVTSPVPSDGTHGSNTAFVTTATFNYITGLPLTTTDPNGLRTEIEYDTATMRPRFTRTFSGSTQVGSTSETIYHDEPNNYWVKNRSQIDENKWAESITYFDGLGRAWKSEQVDSGGNIFTEKEFDADGRVSRVTNPFRANETKVWTTNVYDEASRIKEVILPDGAKVKTDYGVSVNAPIGVTKQITDQAGKKRTGITNVLGQMVRVIEDPTGQNLNTDYVFDTLGNLRKTTQGEQSRYLMHDSLGRLLYAKQPEQDTNSYFSATDPVSGNTAWSAKYEYDDNGNITKTWDAKYEYVEGSYDNLNRIKTRNYSISTTPDVEFYYDGKYRDISGNLQTASGAVNGKTTGVKSSVSQTNYTAFDELGRLETHQQITDGQIYATSYEYNLSGALIEETYPSGRKVKNTLGLDGELLQVQSKKNANYGFHTYAGSFAYDSSGSVTKMRLGNGRWETASYNNRQQITQIGLGATDNAQDLLKLEYNYTTSSTTNNNGSLREQKITVPTVGVTSGFTATQTYLYDDLNRLQSAEEKVSGATTWKQAFTIDRYGNRKFDAANTTTLGSCSTAVCNPTANTSDNRFSTTDGYDYDENGNVTQDAEGQDFIYDAENHQTEVKDNLGNTIGQYLYDGEGKRVKKISNTETTIFVYNAGGVLVAEYSTELATTQQVSYLTADHLGSPRIITNENGVVTDRKDYSAFGEESTSSQRSNHAEYASADELRKGYTGYEKDTESGLDFAQARYYNASHGRYTSIDPLTASITIKNPQSFNRYSYVLNSPYKYTDPLGLLPSSTGADGGGCSAEFSSCENLSESERETHEQNQAVVDLMRAVQAFKRGHEKEAWAIIRANANLEVSGNGFEPEVNSANEPTVTVEASVGVATSEVLPDPVPIFDNLWSLHLGKGKAFIKNGWGPENQCAINMYEAMREAGIDVSGFTGKMLETKVLGITREFAADVNELSKWLLANMYTLFSNNMNGPLVGFTNQNWKSNLQGTTSDFTNSIVGKRGIVISFDSWRNKEGNIRGHVDLWNGLQMRRESASIGVLQSGREMFFIPLE